MKIKRFFAPDMRQAIQQVRAEQGPDAVILSTHTTTGGVEIVAAVDYDAALISSMAEPGHRAPASAPREPAEPPIEWARDPALTAMQEELGTLRAMLQDQVIRLAAADHERRYPVLAETVRRLTGLGFDEAVARQAAEAANAEGDPARAWRDTLTELAGLLPTPAADPLERGGVIALVGATGVGKTTTAAKLAARCAIRYGRGSVALVSTDDYRVGAQRQLASFGLLLGLPVRQARSAAELAAHIGEFGSRRIVIVDTAGVSQRDAGLIQETRELLGVAEVRSYLVMSANVQREVMDEVAGAFGRYSPAGCILTKLDEAARLGPAISALARHRLPIAYLSEGQRVPEDLKIARAQELVARAITVPNRAPHPPHAAEPAQLEVDHVRA